MKSNVLTQSMPSTSFTKEANAEVFNYLNFDDKQDFEDALKGFIAPLETKTFSDDGKISWDLEKIQFINGPAPDTVNPSLWRNTQLHAITGLFNVVEGVYQVRGQGLATTIFIEGENGVIVVDPQTYNEWGKAAIDLYYKYRPKKPVTAIIVSQSHVDHWGGIQGVLQYAEHPQIPIIAPKNFTVEALSENVLLGSIMSRRGEYQTGRILPADSKGQVNVGIGMILGSGSMSFEVPTIEIENDIQTKVIDGITFKFLLTLNTEAPSEMHFYIQDYKVLFASENANKTMHNIYTVRGAKTRDALGWANALDQTIDLYKDEEIDALIMIHSWPVWSKKNALEHLKLQRDLYKYMHDQTIRLANHGYTMDEIAEMIKLPNSLNSYWGNRGYYGTLKHNSKGIYNFYLGYYSANPSDLDPLPQVESGKKYVQYMGGTANVLKQAQDDYEKGEYRWVAQVLKNVVMADATNSDAKHLLANAYEQLGYQAESAIWRNIYLVGAAELRNGVKQVSGINPSAIAMNMPVDEFLKLLAVKLNGPKADGIKLSINVTISNTNQFYTIYLENSVLTYKKDKLDSSPNVVLNVDRLTFYGIGLGSITPDQAIAEGKLELSGEHNKLNEFLTLLDSFDRSSNIVTP